MKRNSQYIKVGFWNDPRNQYPEHPMVDNCVDNEWDDEERQLIIQHVNSGRICGRFRGFSICRICGERNGSTEQTDGKYLWPSGLAHYISEHGVKPSEDFVEWVKSKR